MKKRILSFLCAIVMLLSTCSIGMIEASAVILNVGGEWLDESGITPKPDEYDYSFAIVGDTQSITYTDAMRVEAGQQPTYLKQYYKWIVDNKDSKKIAHVFGLGDVVDHGANDTEWQIAKDAISQMDGKISYSINRGNHDSPIYLNNYLNTEAYRAQYSGANGGFSPVPSVFADDPYESTVPASAGYMGTAWKIFDAGNEKYLSITIDCDPTLEALTWADNIITEKTALYPNIKVVISTHSYLNPKGIRHTAIADSAASNKGALTALDVYNKVVAKHDNVVLAMGGHFVNRGTAEVTREDLVINQTVKSNGGVLTEMLCDPQDIDAFYSMTSYRDSNNQLTGEAPAGLVCMYYFMKDGTIRVEWYSPLRDAYFDACNQRIIKRDLTSISPTSDKISAAEKASVRISSTETGLRFKTSINKTYLDALVASGKTVKVGTLIVPYDTVALLPEFSEYILELYNVKYLDVPATIDKPFAEDSENYIYAGSITSLKPQNITRDFAAIGYVEVDGVKTYANNGYATRNAYDVATAALNDTSATFSEAGGYVYEMTVNGVTVYSPYTESQRAILQTILNTADGRDPFGKDEF